MKRYLTELEQQRLLRAAKTNTCPLAQRDYWWMRLLIEAGARVEEFSLISAEQAEAALRTGWLVTFAWQRKGRKAGHEYLVTTSVRECLQALLAIQQQQCAPVEADGPAPLVWGREGQRLSVRSYQDRLRHWAREAGLGMNVSPHWLRHTRGMNIMRRTRGATASSAVKVAQRALGHASLASTGIYLEMAREDYAQALQSVDTARLSRRAAVAQAQALNPNADRRGVAP